MSAATSAPIEGVCDPRFAAVREAFAGNFAEHGEIGAAVSVFVGGRKVVDLWGGWADRAHAAVGGGHAGQFLLDRQGDYRHLVLLLCSAACSISTRR